MVLRELVGNINRWLSCLFIRVSRNTTDRHSANRFAALGVYLSTPRSLTVRFLVDAEARHEQCVRVFIFVTVALRYFPEKGRRR